MRGNRNLDPPGVDRVNARHFLYVLRGDPQHVPSVAQGIGSFEQHELEILTAERSPARDFHNAAIIADAAGQHESAGMRDAVYSNLDLLHRANHLRESRNPIRQLTRRTLKPRVDIIDDASIESRAAHH